MPRGKCTSCPTPPGAVAAGLGRRRGSGPGDPLPVQADMGGVRGLQVCAESADSAPQGLLNCQQPWGRCQGRDRGKGDPPRPGETLIRWCRYVSALGERVLEQGSLAPLLKELPVREKRQHLLLHGLPSSDGGDMTPTLRELPVRWRSLRLYLGRFLF